MYGDGYVLIYNVIPDGKTLTFVKKQFDPASGINTKTNEKTNDTYKGNYSQNIIRLEDVPLDYIWKYFNKEHFTNNNGTIELKSTPGGGGSSDTDLSVLNDYSLGNIYKSLVTSNTILAAGSDGKIMANSSIPLGCLRGYPSNKSSIDARLTALENSSSGDMSKYATTAQIIEIQNLIQSYHSPESGGSGVMHIQIFTGAPNQSGDSSMPVTNSTTGAFNLKTAIENGGVRLHGTTSTTNRLFAPPCDGFIVGSMVAVENGESLATLYIRHYTKEDNGTVHTVNLGFIKVCDTTSEYAEGASITIPVYKGDIYTIARNNRSAAEEVLMFIGKS